MNDIRISKQKIIKFLGEPRRKNTDRAYTHEEIKKILDVTDLRVKSVKLKFCNFYVKLFVPIITIFQTIFI